MRTKQWFLLGVILTAMISCEQEEIVDNNTDQSEIRFNLCVNFTDPSLDSFDPFTTNSYILDHLIELPYYTSDFSFGDGDQIEVLFSNFILVEDAFNETTQTDEVLYHLMYEGRGHVEVIVLDCLGNNVTESYTDQANQALTASGEYLADETTYSKYRYFLLEE